ncbi:MAG TPA: glycosyltransferase family 4 protein [Candidatus Brocadiia bacterium]|nr:glycosyltransferase family 4 protein [Candidatus Brocadiia bacterium]
MAVKRYKVVLFHIGAWHRYEVPRAFHEAGVLHTFVTTAAYQPHRSPFYRMLGRAPLAGGFLSRRVLPDVPPAKVHATWGPDVLATTIHRAISHSRAANINREQTHWLGRKAAAMALGRGLPLVCYYYSAYTPFRILEGSGLPRIIMQCHPHPASCRRILSEEIRMNPDWKDNLLSEHEFLWGDAYYRELRDQADRADGAIVASDFTKRTLVENGFPPEKIRIAPYGAHPLPEWTKSIKPKRDGFKVLFIGNLRQRKGVSYLIDACRGLNAPGLKLILAGRCAAPFEVKNAPDWLDVRKDVSTSELWNLYKTCDVFAVPSLIEGFGQVYWEAMAAGLPIIATTNTGAVDIIREGREGFIVGIRDVNAIRERLQLLHDDPQRRIEMGNAAEELAMQSSWERYRKVLGEKLVDLLDELYGKRD